jgi:hypothetical protein
MTDGEKKGECYALLNHLDSQEKLAIDYDGYGNER